MSLFRWQYLSACWFLFFQVYSIQDNVSLMNPSSHFRFLEVTNILWTEREKKHSHAFNLWHVIHMCVMCYSFSDERIFNVGRVNMVLLHVLNIQCEIIIFHYIELSRFYCPHLKKIRANQRKKKRLKKKDIEPAGKKKSYNDVDIKRFIAIYNNEKWVKVTRLSAFFFFSLCLSSQRRFNAPFIVHMMPKSWIIDVTNRWKAA